MAPLLTDQVLQYCRARRRDPLAADAVVTPFVSNEDRSCRRGGNRKQAMPRCDRARRRAVAGKPSNLRGLETPRCCRLRLRRQASPNRRSRGNALHRFQSMDDRFRLCDEGENGDRMNGGAGTERSGTDALHHVAKAACISVMSISGQDLIVASIVVAMMMFRTFVAVAGNGLAVVAQSEAKRPQASAGRLRKMRRTRARRQYRDRVGEHLLPQFRQSVQHRGDKHVAGNAAHDVQMNGRHRSGACIDGNDVRSLGDHGHGHVIMSDDALGDRPVDRRNNFDSGDPPLLRIKALREELHATEPHRLQLHLRLPLVDLRQRLGRQRAKETRGPSSTSFACARRNSSEPKPSEHSEAMIKVPPGDKMSSGVTMPFTV